MRLHGDLFLENMLWRPADDAAGNSPQLVLIDPVSVAGVMGGPPLFDLVKYESYATGELPALRSEWVEVAGFDGSDDYRYRVRWDSAELAPFRRLDWHTRFRRAFDASDDAEIYPGMGTDYTMVVEALPRDHPWGSCLEREDFLVAVSTDPKVQEGMNRRSSEIVDAALASGLPVTVWVKRHGASRHVTFPAR